MPWAADSIGPPWQIISGWLPSGNSGQIRINRVSRPLWALAWPFPPSLFLSFLLYRDFSCCSRPETVLYYKIIAAVSSAGNPSRIRGAVSLCGYDGIGRRAGFRFLCRKACGFDPHYPYHIQLAHCLLLPLFCYGLESFPLGRRSGAFLGRLSFCSRLHKIAIFIAPGPVWL